MGIYYEYAIVHGRVLVWWHDLKGMPHSKWIENPEAEGFLEKLNDRDFKTQQDLASLIKIKD